ncbi:bifunctional 2-C-methyl-D-erythritol 4-phosphate cytidylyltransferase/2-C-methyl-D-erythritol 2,4-cyclodiphosphate synthase [Georhizobium profundi]|uniref:Bifunctional enzyme IspD/IspF n=1 Tax=Georhizobium profundi TaxID=2341112 RepID=A0A3S9B543_9HYPH|nr:bifunctional 2-C-methyl-D-erythritol 4-phosphate cytidylyltransferase/2-C-methyl-D-erythritol 2,4-cyclodiphosphate synthase [Georhizobium profundi]AZN72039.1 bifunctional 2-C-methyl-D-erythritol 4-phosphate cytidylyltransferase/2-C-methyl-D-erythritol 2,4-cyclodiphosphate synthase [Georhizobium profundi]
MDRVAAVIVAAGRGERAGDPSEGPKQYRQIGNAPVLAHALLPFIVHEKIDDIVVVIHPDDEDVFTQTVQPHLGGADIKIVFGDRTRQMSVRRGLESLSDRRPSHVMIHDGARPFIERPVIDRVLAGLKEVGDAILPGIAVADTLKSTTLSQRVLKTVPRDGLYAAQTPQGFAYSAILDAHRRAAISADDGFTDDASIAEWADIPVGVVEGSTQNIKLTVREDIAMADQKLSAKAAYPDVRTGNGYDVHRLEPGDGVTLCGVFIAHDQRLSGHSDADVGYHALTDALLATCGAGDIGDHFPPSDPQWKGARSSIFLQYAAEIVRSRGGTITNADVSLICEAPRIGPHREAMRAAMAKDLAIAMERCSVKATTNEMLGFIGRGEGIAAIATATVIYGGLRDGRDNR